MLKLKKLPIKRRFSSIGVLCSGGDAPGMNAAIRAVVRYGISQGCTVYGIMRGFSGLLEGQMMVLDASSVANIIQRGGTILKTSRCEEFFKRSGRRTAANNLRSKGIEGLVAIGGDGTFRGAYQMEKETGYPVIGVPGTIDNDIVGSDDTIGFDTAVNTGIEAIDRIRDTASSHDRLFLVEVMGRSSGFIALQVGIGGGAETIVVPEQGKKVSTTCNQIISTLTRGVQRGKSSSIVVVAEGPVPGLSNLLSEALTKQGFSPRVCILGHTQRGGTPTAHDRFLASSLGAAGVAYLLAGESAAMVGVQADEISLVPFSRISGKKKPLPPEPLHLAQVLAT